MNPSSRVAPFFKMTVLATALALSGCASTNNPRDPLEGFNRTMFNFNDKVDQVALKPAAKVYRAVLPSFVQTGVGNFFGNLGDVWTGLNNVLQGKVGDGLSDFMRFAVNSTIGIGGLLDISSEAGIPKHKEDFGQTLGRWGVASGPYVVLPLLGSSTVRDTAALPLDYKGDLWSYVDPVWVRNTGTVLRIIDARASVLDASDLIEGAALDRYEFVRDAYLQRRESRINDGNSREDDNSTAPGRNRDGDKNGTTPGGTGLPVSPRSDIGESLNPIASTSAEAPAVDSAQAPIAIVPAATATATATATAPAAIEPASVEPAKVEMSQSQPVVVAEVARVEQIATAPTAPTVLIEDCNKASSVESALSCQQPPK